MLSGASVDSDHNQYDAVTSGQIITDSHKSTVTAVSHFPPAGKLLFQNFFLKATSQGRKQTSSNPMHQAIRYESRGITLRPMMLPAPINRLEAIIDPLSETTLIPDSGYGFRD